MMFMLTQHARTRRASGALLALAFCLAAAGCKTTGTDLSQPPSSTRPMSISEQERQCLIRAMYFEGVRNDRNSLLAVGTAVKNRQASAEYPKTICGVVGQKNQFARGVLTRSMNARDVGLAATVADEILKGVRHSDVKNAKHFHTAGRRFPYRNMQYVSHIGGNSFYIKVSREDRIKLALNQPR